jgi:Protein of unknown function (DUF3987)
VSDERDLEQLDDELQGIIDDVGPDPVPDAPWLDPDSAALGGLAGEVVRAFADHTEADPAALLVNLLATFGAMVGPMAEAHVGFAQHPPALFVGVVGKTSRSRKGTATQEIAGLMCRVEDGWHEQHEVSGFGSGEAFIEHAAERPGDAIYMIEPELARVLAVASWEGSTASSALRLAWDFRRIELRVRRKRYEAPAAPIVLVGHITMDELRDARHGMQRVEIVNGFANRVLWAYVDRRRTVPNPTRIPEHVLTPLVADLRAALMAARGAGVVERTADAEVLWHDLYGQIAADDGPGIIDALTARAEAQVLRLSLIYALLAGSRQIERQHLEAAWEVWRYCRWSAQHVFVGRGTGDPDIDRIVERLDAGDELTARELDRMFLGHRSTAELRERAIALGVAVESRRETGGRPARLLMSSDKADQAGKGRWWIRTALSEGLDE